MKIGNINKNEIREHDYDRFHFFAHIDWDDIFYGIWVFFFDYSFFYYFFFYVF